MGDDADDTDAADWQADRRDAELRILGFAKAFSLIDPDIESEPGMVKRIRQIVDYLPDRTLADLLDNVARANAGRMPDIDGFCSAHGISPAESRLLTSLVAGGSVGSHAAHANISINTARTHMRRLLDKTGAASQLDLMRRYFQG